MYRILLLGRTGQVGSELLRLLPGLGRVSAPTRETADLCAPESLRALVRRECPDTIVNAAAYTNVDGAESEPELAFKANAEAPRVLADAAAACGALLVHYSTDYVFDGCGMHPYREGDPVRPLNVYGRSKLAGEQAVLGAGCRTLIFRTSWIYGLRGRNFLLTVRRLAAEGKPLRIVSDQVGAPTWCRSVAMATVDALRRIQAGSGASGVFHMTCGGQTNWCDFARAFLPPGTPVEAISTEAFPRPAVRPRFSVLDNSRLETELGIRLPSWGQALRDCLGCGDLK